jgi:hypothetical protein
MAKPFQFDKNAPKANLHADRWEKLKRPIDAAVKSGPKHGVKPKPKRTMGKGRARVGKSKA